MQTFSKKERLCSRKKIQDLFSSGKIFYVHPFKVIWERLSLENPEPVQIMVSVPKRNIRKAVMRNKIKRRIREAYRKNKFMLAESSEGNIKYTIIFIFTAREEIPYKDIESKIIQVLQRLPIQYAKDTQ